MGLSMSNVIDDNVKHQDPTNAKIALLMVFILSGFAGLIYQSVWSQYLGLFLGHAAYAQALVLAIFMGGMALGAIIIARYGEKKNNLVQKYAIIEAIIGILGLLFHYIFNFFVGFSYDTLIPATDSSFMITLIRWTVAFILIVPQTILLGMTFPLMSSGLMRRFPNQAGSLLSGLYFTNSIGAAFGALISTFVLLPQFGLMGSTVVAGILNLVVAFLAYMLSRSPEPKPQPIQVSKTDTANPNNTGLLKVVLFGTALSGAASFAYEIIWIRMLSMAVGSTLHAFELMLTSFIMGIAFGGLWVRKKADSSEYPLRLVGFMQIFMGMAALMSLWVYANSFEWVGWLIRSLTDTDGGYGLYTLGTAVIAISIMMPAAFFAGTTLPLFTVALLRNNHGEKAIGQVYASNTLGSIIGVFLTIYFLIPFLGLKLALVLSAMVDMGIGVYLLRHQAEKQRDFQMVGVTALSVLVATALAMQVRFDPQKLAAGVFRTGEVSLNDNVEILYYKDGQTASISTRLHQAQQTISIATNGKSDAAIVMNPDISPTADEPTMILLGTLPLALHDNPKHVGVIGFGSGLSTHTLLGDKRVEKVDTIEIEEAVIEGAKAFGHRVERAYNDPRSNIVIDDAKSYFSGQKTKYDIIVSEPSNPWISGIGALFATEFYEFIPRHLNDDGLFVQWIQLYEIDDALISSILKGLTVNFSDYRAYVTHSDLIIVAKANGTLPTESEVIFNDILKPELEYQGIYNIEHIKRHTVADANVLRAYANMYDTKINSYYYPYLSLEAPKTRFKKKRAMLLSHDLPLADNMLLEALDIRHPITDYDRVMNAKMLSLPNQHSAFALLTKNYLLGNTDISLAFDKELLPFAQANAWKLANTSELLCKSPNDKFMEEQFAKNLLEVTNDTLDTLDVDSQKGLFIDPAWLKCSPETLSFETQHMLAFLDAMAKRDWAEASDLAELRLKNPPADTVWKGFDPWMLNTVLINHAKNNEWQKLIEAEQELSETAERDDTLLIPLLLSMAEQHLEK